MTGCASPATGMEDQQGAVASGAAPGSGPVAPVGACRSSSWGSAGPATDRPHDAVSCLPMGGQRLPDAVAARPVASVACADASSCLGGGDDLVLAVVADHRRGVAGEGGP